MAVSSAMPIPGRSLPNVFWAARKMLTNITISLFLWRLSKRPGRGNTKQNHIFGPESGKYGPANVVWMYIAATQYMLGTQAQWNGLRVVPCLAEEMLPAKVTRVFRGCIYHITTTCSGEDIFISHAAERKDYPITF